MKSNQAELRSGNVNAASPELTNDGIVLLFVAIGKH